MLSPVSRGVAVGILPVVQYALRKAFRFSLEQVLFVNLYGERKDEE